MTLRAVELDDVGKKTIEMKRKADDAYDQICSHKDQRWRATKELVSAEEGLNDSLGRLGQLVVDCGVPDRESNEARYLQEALDMIEEFWNGKGDQCWH